MLAGPVHLDFVELRELDAVVGRAELVDFEDAAGCLLSELVAGEVEDFESLGGELLVEGFQLFVLGREAAAGGGVDDEQHLTLVVGERHGLSVGAGHLDVVDTFLGLADGGLCALRGGDQHEYYSQQAEKVSVCEHKRKIKNEK